MLATGLKVPISAVFGAQAGGAVAWTAATLIAQNTIVSNAGSLYLCNTTHTSASTFAADASNFTALGSGGGGSFAIPKTATTSGTAYTLTPPLRGESRLLLTLTGNCVITLTTGATVGEVCAVQLHLVQDATGSRHRDGTDLVVMNPLPSGNTDATRGKYLIYTFDSISLYMYVRVGGSANPLTGYGNPITCTTPDGTPLSLWHMDIIQEASGRFVLAYEDTQANGKVWLATSWDGINWRVAPRSMMRTNSWATGGLYRSSIRAARSGSGYDMIVARQQSAPAGLGLTRNVPATEIP